MATCDFFFITCEHGGNRIPSRYRDFFRGGEAQLHTHHGYDVGALRMARDMADALCAPLLACTISRLLVDLNRSPGHPKLFSDMTRSAAPSIRKEIFQCYYYPYRDKTETRIAQAIAGGARVIHISCHTFAPEIDGNMRNADLGLLYDPARAAEADFCRRWRTALKIHAPTLKARMNYPYAGTDDGFTTHLRRRFLAENYLGIELEINQKHVLERVHWRALRNAIIEALRDIAQVEKPSEPGVKLFR